MSDRELCLAFRAAALDQGLLYKNWAAECGDSKCGHWFDLAGGEITAQPEEYKVRDLVLLAFDHAATGWKGGWGGEHLSLLGLVAERADIEAFEAGRLQILLWRRGLETDWHLSLRSWLAEKGHFFPFDDGDIYVPPALSLLELAYELAVLAGKIVGVEELTGRHSRLDPLAGVGDKLVLVPIDHQPGFGGAPSPSGTHRELLEEMDPRLAELTERFRSV